MGGGDPAYDGAMSDREIRLPLSLGVTCLTDLAVGVIAVPLGAAIACAAVLLVYWAGADVGDGLKFFIGMLVVGGGSVFLGARATIRAWRYRPSDLLIDETGIRIDGGSRDGLAATWPAIAKARCEIKASPATIITIRALIATLLDDRTDEHYYRFHLGDVIVAETDSGLEADSFREIAGAMTERATPPSDPEVVPDAIAAPAPPPPERTDSRGSKKHQRKMQRKQDAAAAAGLPPPTHAPRVVAATAAPAHEIGILKCGGCGAVIAPSDLDATTCAFCAAMTEIPAELRERVRAAASLGVQAKRAERVVVKLLDQPSAREMSKWIAASTLFIAAAWPLTVWMYVHLAHAHRLTAERGALLGLLPFLLVLDGFFLSRLRLVDRVALRSLALTFAARAAARAGDPPCCRACLAPLPALTTTVIACIYCSAANVTRVDLRGRARRSELSAESLEHALVAHDRERLWWRLASIVGIACFVGTGALLRHVLR